MKGSSFLLFLIFLATGCSSITPQDQGDDSSISIEDSLSTTRYEESSQIIANPERGFYAARAFHSDAYRLTAVEVKTTRLQRRTLFYTGYYLTDFMESDISESYLDMMRSNFLTLREGGAKCILRFAYKSSEDDKPWDAKPEWVKRHIEQLKPLLQEFGDVILCLQAGFVGVWGEWYYTENFYFAPYTPEQHKLRKEVVDALLDAMPSDRQIALRTPMFKRMMYCESYADTLTAESAFNGSFRARLCGHNDCFGADKSDMGTFEDAETREFWKSETKYVMMGGETCQVSSYCQCSRSLKDMEDYHWTYLNRDYNSLVLNGWNNGGCMKEIERRLGYRLSLAEVRQTADPAAGKDFRIVFDLRNTGFAAPVNPRGVELILIDGNGNKTVYTQDDVDPRYWFAGEKHTLDKVIKLPAGATGRCTLYLNLPDPEVTLHDNPLFSIRLANDDLWDETTGYNKIAEFIL